MEILKNFEKQNEEKTVDFFINSKVDDLIERSVQEGKKRSQIEIKVENECGDISTTEGFEYLSSISDFSDFPKYKGRGFQENAPDISGSLSLKGEACLTMWFADVYDNEVKNFKQSIVNAGFTPQGSDYVKKNGDKTLTMSVSASAGKLRIFHKITIKA